MLIGIGFVAVALSLSSDVRPALDNLKGFLLSGFRRVN